MKFRLLTAGLLAVFSLASACGSSGNSDSGNDVVVTESVVPPSGGDRAVETRDRLMRKASLSGQESLELADAHLTLGNATAAENAYFNALSRGGLTPHDAYRAHLGLGLSSERLGQYFSAKSHYSDAWRAAQTDQERDDALVELAQVEIRIGDKNSAREHRRAIRDGSRPEVAALDRELGEAPAARNVGASPPPPAVAARPRGRGVVAAPAMHSRAEWRARPVASHRDTDPMGTPTRLTFHHTADLKPVGSSQADVAERVHAYQTAHQQTDGWADIGYHFVVDAQGRIWEGRSLTLKGAHAGNKAANENNIGIALIGNFEITTPTAAQMKSAEALAVWLCSEYRIASNRIYSHHQMEEIYHIKGTTRCPGRKFDPYLAQIKRSVERLAK